MGTGKIGREGAPEQTPTRECFFNSNASFFVIERFAVGTDLDFRPLSIRHDLCFIGHKLVVLDNRFDLEKFALSRFHLESVFYRGRE